MAAVDSLHFWGLPEGPRGFWHNPLSGGNAGEAIFGHGRNDDLWEMWPDAAKTCQAFFFGFQLISPQDRIPSEYHEYPISREFRWTCRGWALARHDIPKNSVFFRIIKTFFCGTMKGWGKPIKTGGNIVPIYALYIYIWQKLPTQLSQRGHSFGGKCC